MRVSLRARSNRASSDIACEQRVRVSMWPVSNKMTGSAGWGYAGCLQDFQGPADREALAGCCMPELQVLCMEPVARAAQGWQVV